MKRIVLDASGFVTKADMFNRLHEALGSENFYGSNLDALHDKLTMIFEPTELVVKNFPEAIRHLGVYANVFWHVLDDSTEENKFLTVRFE